MKASGVIWDIDDVLVDTSGMYLTSRHRALGHLKINDTALAMSIWDRLFWFYEQDRTEAMLKALLHELQHDVDDLAFETALGDFNTVWAEEIVPVDGIIDLVLELEQRGVPQAIVSNGKIENQQRKLQAIGLAEFFSSRPVVIEASGSDHSKPTPHGIWRACELLDIQPGTALYVGDRPTDMIAANLAGATGVFFSRSFHAPEVLRPPQGDAIGIERASYSTEGVRALAELLFQLT